MRPKPTPGPWQRSGREIIGNLEYIATVGYSTCDDETQIANAEVLAASMDFLEACTHKADGESTRLDWLSAVLAECDANFKTWAGDDPDAAFTALREAQALLNALRAAVKKAGGRHAA